jgi:hypothetical protein
MAPCSTPYAAASRALSDAVIAVDHGISCALAHDHAPSPATSIRAVDRTYAAGPESEYLDRARGLFSAGTDPGELFCLSADDHRLSGRGVSDLRASERHAAAGSS